MSRPVKILALCSALAACAPAFADSDLLGIYVGAGVGRAELKQDYYQIDAHTTGWKLFAGWRPLSFIGVEAEYADFGSKDTNTYAGTAHVSADAKAAAVFGMFYLPVPVPWIDVYGKVGVADTKANTSIGPTGASVPACPGTCPPGVIYPATYDNSRTAVAWGAGLQFKVDRLAARLEYELFDGPQGNPTLLSAELTYSF